jgi:hypothetical protein
MYFILLLEYQKKGVDCGRIRRVYLRTMFE